LRNELQGLPGESVVLALGGIAHKAVIRALQLRQVEFKFGHGELHELGNGIRLLDSYHCSRYNTNTGRLTEDMFREIFSKAESLLDP
jgi:uracil-DNA glycosylase